jgi:hypothetical protein
MHISRIINVGLEFICGRLSLCGLAITAPRSIPDIDIPLYSVPRLHGPVIKVVLINVLHMQCNTPFSNILAH